MINTEGKLKICSENIALLCIYCVPNDYKIKYKFESDSYTIFR